MPREDDYITLIATVCEVKGKIYAISTGVGTCGINVNIKIKATSRHTSAAADFHHISFPRTANVYDRDNQRCDLRVCNSYLTDFD